MRIRLANVDDLPAILRLEKDAFGPERFSDELAERLITAPDITTLVAEDGKVEAYVMVHIIRSYETGDVLSLAVSKARRRQGLGRKVMEEVERLSSDEGVITMMLYVRPDNVSAVSLYISLGYKVLARCRGYYPDGSDADMMVKHLEDRDHEN
ncbi:MAG: GNAT family N-acetyltransferase [Methanomassiliicoccales archaeon]|nr:GNAT family N-acetyltransferase [Methanomassiliicoccales archaeon]